MPMTFEEVKQGAAELSEEDRLRLSAFLKHLARVDTDENKAELSRLNRQIDEGNYVTLEQLREISAALEAEGR